KPLAVTAAVNTTKYALLKSLAATGLPVETGSGGLTKFNRTQQGLKRIDAACVGQSTPHLIAKNIKPLLIKAEGNGNRKLCITDKFGFPKKHRPRKKLHFGFRTGDIVKAVVTKGKNAGTYIGRVAIRSNGSFDIS
ncbi:MAG: HNH endonuclease, partial [Sphaerospermopsis kisseleviana]